MDNRKARLLRDIRLAKFAMIEANLFLDTHPTDQDAIAYFEKYESRYKSLKEEWERLYGRVAVLEDGKKRWRWVDNPWPWQEEE